MCAHRMIAVFLTMQCIFNDDNFEEIQQCIFNIVLELKQIVIWEVTHTAEISVRNISQKYHGLHKLKLIQDDVPIFFYLKHALSTPH